MRGRKLETSYHFSIAPIGGLFLVVMGSAVAVGGLLPPYRVRLLWAGFILGAAAAYLWGHKLYAPPPPTGLQLGFLVTAVALEALAFGFLMPRLYRSGPRAVTAGTLGIVGAHFLVMTPALGPASSCSACSPASTPPRSGACSDIPRSSDG